MIFWGELNRSGRPLSGAGMNLMTLPAAITVPAVRGDPSGKVWEKAAVLRDFRDSGRS